jgi:mRNA interferase RelE/StbE
MFYRRSPKFRKALKALPKDIQAKVPKAFELFQENRDHPSLGVKKVKGHDNIWEGRIDRFYRFTFEFIEDEDTSETGILFRNIGRHEIVDHEP